MRIRFYLLFIVCFLFGCGSDSHSPSTNEQISLSIIQKYDFQTEGEAQTQDFTLPQNLNDANWGLKEIVCQQSGYDLAPYAGQIVSSMRYSLLEKCNGESLKLWVLIKEHTCICAYITGESVPGVYAVNDACIQ